MELVIVCACVCACVWRRVDSSGMCVLELSYVRYQSNYHMIMKGHSCYSIADVCGSILA